MKIPLRKLCVCIALLALAPGLRAASEIFTAEEVAGSFGGKQITTPPEPVDQSNPRRPGETLSQAGTVKVAFLIDLDGKVLKPRIADSTNELLNDHALKVVSRWKFKPGKKEGEPVVVRLIVPLLFQKED